MGPYGLVRAHIKTGWSHMAQDHFWTPPDPQNHCFRGALELEEAVVQMCAWGLFAIYIDIWGGVENDPEPQGSVQS